MKRPFYLFILLLLLAGSSIQCGNGFNTVLISSVQIFRVPSIDTDGSNWDDESENFLPDIYFEFLEEETQEFRYGLGPGSHFTNAGRNSVLVWSTSFSTPVFETLDFDLYDFDSNGADQYMGTVTVNFNRFGRNETPSEVTFTESGTSVRFQIQWF